LRAIPENQFPIMKQIRSLILGLLLALPCWGYAQDYIYGDVNGDDEVSVADVNAVISAIMGDYKYVSIAGSWVSEYSVDNYGEYVISDTDAVSFDFQNNHKGQYSWYNLQNVAWIDLTWEQQFRRLYIWYYDGDHEELYYKIDQNGHLLLALDKQFTTYTAYRRGSLGDAAATPTSTHGQDNVDGKPVPRAIVPRSSMSIEE